MEATTFPINIAKKLFAMRNSIESIPATGEMKMDLRSGKSVRRMYKTEADILGTWNPLAEKNNLLAVPEIVSINYDPGGPVLIEGRMYLIDLDSDDQISLNMWGVSDPMQQKIAAAWTGMIKYMYSKLLAKPSDIDLEDDIPEKPTVQATMPTTRPGKKPELRL